MLRLNGRDTRGKLTSRTSIGVDRTVDQNGKSGGHNFVVSGSCTSDIGYQHILRHIHVNVLAIARAEMG